jgi:hypothetical protein
VYRWDGWGSFLQLDSWFYPKGPNARWIDPSSPYNIQYANSGKVVTDPAFWDDRMRYLDNMARAASVNGLTVQYCMPLPRDLLQPHRLQEPQVLKLPPGVR